MTEAPTAMPNDKVALITGAARGIGLATAKRFLHEGWRVALLDIEQQLLDSATSSLRCPDRTLALHCDVSDAAMVADALERITRRFGRLDALVNNAGVARFAPIMETTETDWQRILDVNLTGPFLCTRAAVPLMREHGGAIVNITSISAVRASTLRSAYGTSKAALAHLTKQLAVELASAGIRVNAVAPGPVETAMAKAVHTPEIRADYHDAIPLNRYGLEEELAEAIFFLSSERSSYITGQVLAVDGGFDAAGIGLPTLRGERRNAQDAGAHETMPSRMRIILTLLLAVVLWGIATMLARADIRIISSPGGEVGPFLSLFEKVRASGERVVIDGPCLSACTLVLSLVPEDRICVTRRAVLGFHAARSVDRRGRTYAEPEASKLVLQTYPAPVRGWIARRGGLTSRLLMLRGRELKAMYASCR